MAAETKQLIDSEGQIRKLIDTWMDAVRAKDVDGSVSPYASDVIAYDLVNPLQYNGSNLIRKRLTEWFSSFEGPIGIEFRDLEVSAGDEVAFCHGLHHVNGTRTDGSKLEMWWRTTLGLRKIEGRWTVTHSHDSVPFNMENGMASFDLKPGLQA